MNPLTSKQPLVLIPGLLCDRRVWEHQIDHLSDLVDPFVPALNAKATPDAMVEAVLRHVPRRFLLAGHSMGGWLALEVMRRYPQRVTKLCILATTAETDPPEKASKRREMMAKVEQGAFGRVAQELANSFIYQQDAKAQVHSMLLRNEDGFLNQQMSLLMRTSCMETLPQIQQPTLAIVGRQDAIFYQETCDIAAHIPQAKLAVIEDCGHMLTLEMPQAVTALMRLWVQFF